MCGITGIFNRTIEEPVNSSLLKKMTETLHHRGPDDYGFYISNNIGLGHSRLSIIDLSGGQQPIFNENKSIVVVFNGEIFNYIELRDFLIKKGHHFTTESDTEVIVHLYEQYGKDFLQHLNGQFAIALFDENNKELILARDRIGIRPLFYSLLGNGTLLFGSEIKSIYSHPGIDPEIDPEGINQVFSLWVNIPPRTVFRNVYELAPGHFLRITQSDIKSHQYWKPEYPHKDNYEDKPFKFYSEKLKELLFDSVSLRLRADVPVASYLSGGIDSSIVSSVVKNNHNNELITFSVAFNDEQFDERPYQMKMVEKIKTDHHIILADYENIGKAFSDVIWYSEKPMIRTAPAPLYLLSGLVKENNIKVVLTGEGADEMLGGYNIFKEDKIRRFWAKVPDSKFRPKLLSSLYPFIAKDQRTARFWQIFFKKGLADTENPYYSHLIRWNNTSQIKKFFNNQYAEHFNEERIYDDLNNYLDKDILRWHPFCRAQYLETALFMPGYLLSSQGDRMMMGHSIEGRFPFLDHRLIEFAGTIPPEYKVQGLNEKYILKKTYNDLLPNSIIHREKQPYRAPISHCFKEKYNSVASSMLSEEIIAEYSIFNPESVKKLINKFAQNNGQGASERDNMSLVGIVSMQLLYHHFIKGMHY